MPDKPDYVPLPKSELRLPLRLGAPFLVQPLSPLELSLIIEIDVVVRRRPDGPPFPDITAIGSQLPRDRKYMSHDDFEAAFGADPADVDAVRDYARTVGLTYVTSDLATRTVTLSGSLEDIGEAFRTHIEYISEGPRRYRAYRGPLHVPAPLGQIVRYVHGIDEIVAAHPMAKTLNWWELLLLNSFTQIHTPRQVADIYNFPQATGKGECIAMLEFGGGFDPQRIHTYFALSGMKTPEVVAVPVAGGANRPGFLPYLDAEVYLDIEVAGVVAPDARLAVYFGPCTARGYVHAFAAAIHDRVNRPSVVFCTWGFAEVKWTAAPWGMDAVDEVVREAALLGVTVLVASGDFGATAGIYDGKPHLYFPASSPHVLTVGGTTLYSSAGTTVTEYTWNRVFSGGGSSTGGYSEYFPVPDYQERAKLVGPEGSELLPGEFTDAQKPLGRAVPDVSALGDPTTGYLILVDQCFTLTAGTSAATPLWSALVARMNEITGIRLGYINPLLYESLGAGAAFRDILLGNNLFYRAGPGWDPCTGWGSPDGTKLLQALNPSGKGAAPSAGAAG